MKVKWNEKVKKYEKVLKLPMKFMRNQTRIDLYEANVNRFINKSFTPSFRDKRFLEFEELLNNNEYTEKEKKRMRREYHLLWYLIGQVPTDYFAVGGLKAAPFWIKHKKCVKMETECFSV